MTLPVAALTCLLKTRQAVSQLFPVQSEVGQHGAQRSHPLLHLGPREGCSLPDALKQLGRGLGRQREIQMLCQRRQDGLCTDVNVDWRRRSVGGSVGGRVRIARALCVAYPLTSPAQALTVVTQLTAEARHAHLRQAARDNVVEKGQVGVAIEAEAMHGDSALHLEAL